MTTTTGYLPLSQESDTTAAHASTPSWITWRVQAVDFITKNVSLLLVICAQFFFASMNLSVKLLERLEPPTPTLELITIRMAITLCCCMIYMLANSVPDPLLGPQGVRGLLVARGLAGFFTLFGMYYALNYLSLADATVITFLGPFSTALAGYFILGETYTMKEALAGVSSLVGVVLIARPTFLFGGGAEGDHGTGVTSFDRLRAVGSVLVSVGGNTATFITMRAIGIRAHPTHVMTFFSFWCTVVAAIAQTTTHEAVVFPMTWQWIVLLLLIGLFGVAAQVLMTVGLHHETATRASLASYWQLLFAVIIEFVVLGTVPTLLSFVGATIIIAAQTYAILAREKPSDKLPEVLSAISLDEVGERQLPSNVNLSENPGPSADEEASLDLNR